MRIVAASADEARFADLQARSATADTPQDKLRYLGALADVTDPALFGRFLELTLSDAVRTQDAPFLLRRAILNRANGAAAWAFVSQHWDTINARLPSAGIPRMLEGVRVVTSAELAEGIDENTGEFVVQSIADILQRNFTLGDAATNNTLDISYEPGMRDANTFTTEAEVTCSIEELLTLNQRN